MDWSKIRPELRAPPASCDCEGASKECIPYGPSGRFIYATGCYTTIEPYLTDLVTSIGGIGIGVACIEVCLTKMQLWCVLLMSLIFSWCLECSRFVSLTDSRIEDVDQAFHKYESKSIYTFSITTSDLIE
jgi:hypothetical protein